MLLSEISLATSRLRVDSGLPNPSNPDLWNPIRANFSPLSCRKSDPELESSVIDVPTHIQTSGTQPAYHSHLAPSQANYLP